MKLRKHLRARRLTDVRQLGVDRIIDFEFASFNEDGVGGFHIIAEFYASGNIILTDHTYKILTLLRVVQSNENVRMVVGEIYDTKSVAREFTRMSHERLAEALDKAGPKDTLKKLLNASFDYGPALTEHAILLAKMDPNAKGISELSKDPVRFDPLLQAFYEADRMVEICGSEQQKGYIIQKKHDTNGSRLPDQSTNDEPALETYEEFHPFLFEQHSKTSHREFPSFDKAVDEFFSALESQKIDLKARQQEEAALKKLESIKNEQLSRAKGLEDAQELNVKKAQLIEENLELVDQAVLVIRNYVASGMDWKELDDLVELEKKRNNPVAVKIAKLKLEKNQITLSLSYPQEVEDFFDSSDEESDETDDFKPMDVDKYSASKHEKTLAASEKALKSAEQKIRQDLKDTKITATINKMRKPFWFEKFLWFISSEGYLIIAGRDMQQNELLVKRHLKKGDIYVHADLHGAASVIVKNKNTEDPIPPSTLFQAGIMSVCQSKAWDAKIVTSAWWVYDEQVSKTAPSGEYLTTGSFMIRGKKNFMPPSHLVYGFGIAFRLDDSSVGNHIIERKIEQEELKDLSRPVLENMDDKIEIIRPEEAQPSPATSDNVIEDNTQSLDDSTGENELVSPTKGDGPSLDGESSNITTDVSKPASPSVDEMVESFDKYNLDEHGEDLDFAPLESKADEGNLNSKEAGEKKKYLSAKERRELKKKKQTQSADSSTPEPAEEIVKVEQAPQKKAEKQKPVQPAPPTTRGKKGKMKKMKEKYADQDEEERELKMALLGSAKSSKKKGKSKGEEQAPTQSKKNQPKGQKPSNKTNPKNLTEASIEADATEGLDNNLIDLPQIPSNTHEAEEIRQLLKEENITLIEGEDAENLTLLDTLTGSPFPDDTLLFAVPVCAPYTSLQKYKYRVKLTPGSMKKGKACKAAINFFLHSNETTPREKELIKSIPEMEMISQMLGKVKVSAANIEAAKSKAKKNKKK
ncbi:DUF814-domain-containing protein [Basidiobolus meristosporus CBS 931.73]|uniref:DUF814-domain-containing protein n=1 Tax=Basidiobolus meristosporus CBS 931.73 TaxID=1314790 RepID=A0A1Y1Y6G5_9FUNG|nr:DUF814-domain-containing protein [Basidiobolus meristosporus CBS 931.73]|eukprot:ORX93174.1 DUF814-domain-containing protein [Basidiobolus meristosporus CBS 931.73]